MKMHTLLSELLEHARQGRLNHQVVATDQHGHSHYLLGSPESVEWSDEKREIYLHVNT